MRFVNNILICRSGADILAFPLIGNIRCIYATYGSRNVHCFVDGTEVDESFDELVATLYGVKDISFP